MADSFLHDHPDFDALLTIVSDRVGVSAALVEKDYWVTHALWALEARGLAVFFNGGTSLSKGFNLIQRFSEDLDVKLEALRRPWTRWRALDLAYSGWPKSTSYLALARFLSVTCPSWSVS